MDFEEAFWRFVDQKWKDSLTVAPAEPVGTGGGQEARSWSLKVPKKNSLPHPAQVSRNQAHGGKVLVDSADREVCRLKSADLQTNWEAWECIPPMEVQGLWGHCSFRRESKIKDSGTCPICMLHSKEENWYLYHS